MVRKRWNLNWRFLEFLVYQNLCKLPYLNFLSRSLKKRTSRLCPYRENTWKWHKVYLHRSLDERKLNRPTNTWHVAPWPTWHILTSFKKPSRGLIFPIHGSFIKFSSKIIIFNFHKFSSSLLSYLSHRPFSRVAPVQESVDLETVNILT